jgi:dienelactone hydrolase
MSVTPIESQITEIMENVVLKYASRVDNTGPLYGEAFWDEGAKRAPLVVIMAGFSGDRTHVANDGKRWAQKGFCALTVDMRGRGMSAGRPDCGAVEIHDIIDALDCACERLGSTVDQNRCSIIGYSGGGGNVLSAVTKFPDRFQVAVSFFGISDYGFWYASGALPYANKMMDDWVGGAPATYPTRYQARNSVRAAGNCLQTKVYLFCDEEETACPPAMNEMFAEAARQKGHKDVVSCVSRRGDAHRWKHGYTSDNPDLILAENIFEDDMRTRQVDLTLPEHGQMTVAGYVVTRGFQYWIRDGRDGAGEITYKPSY